jgi:hypothetical protein
MKHLPILASALLLAGASNDVLAADKVWPELGVPAAIMFPQRNIRNFEADEDRGVWIEDQQRRWYYARLIGICPGLKFAQGIGFDTRGSSRFDRSSLLLVDGDHCAIESLVTSKRPLPRKEREKVVTP